MKEEAGQVPPLQFGQTEWKQELLPEDLGHFLIQMRWSRQGGEEGQAPVSTPGSAGFVLLCFD